ncbi:uncharacterized protein LOC135399499 [Ornithodoros turicata]|uniref:uncharacterized protein LOC135399499 n=1 Tax=Ornithodoros turicata TaxID=34597 RepID=UPI003139F5BA
MDIEAAADFARQTEGQLLANMFTMASVMFHGVPRFRRQQWAFERNERWFEETLPYLGHKHFKQAFRVSPATFRYLLESLQSIERQDTNMRNAISLEKRVAVGLYRLCSSAEDRTIAHLFAIGRSTVNAIFKDFCDAVILHLEQQWICMVRRNEMESHMREFHAVTGFPQAIRALGGCHLPVSPPKLHATDYYNYKGWYSIILLALVDHQYKFKYINVGSPGRCHDAHVYGRSRLRSLVDGDHFQSPVVTIEGTFIPPIILCDQAFPLTSNLLKPFANAPKGTPQASFNYNLSKTRRIVENAFGRVKARFRHVMKRMECNTTLAKRSIRTACTLHNICETLSDTVEVQWEQDAHALDMVYAQPSRGTDVCHGGGQAVRNALAAYFWKKYQS